MLTLLALKGGVDMTISLVGLDAEPDTVAEAALRASMTPSRLHVGGGCLEVSDWRPS